VLTESLQLPGNQRSLHLFVSDNTMLLASCALLQCMRVQATVVLGWSGIGNNHPLDSQQS
jgi:hypothetical protein